jgi:hypothetical protein
LVFGRQSKLASSANAFTAPLTELDTPAFGLLPSSRFGDGVENEPSRKELTALIFLAAMAVMLYYFMINRPVQSLAGFLMMLIGLVLYENAQVRVSQVPGPRTTSIPLHN